MAATDRALALRSELEASLLRLSVGATILIAGLGVAFGLVSNLLSIIFGGLFSVVDAVITGLMLAVARLVAREQPEENLSAGAARHAGEDHRPFRCAEIGAEIGEAGPDRWLTSVFTEDPRLL